MSHGEENEKTNRWQISMRDIILFVAACGVASLAIGVALRFRIDAYPSAVFHKMWLIEFACILLGACVGGLVGRGIRPKLWVKGAYCGAIAGLMISSPFEWFAIH